MIKSIKLFFSILNYKQKKLLILLLIMSFIGALLELISLGLLIPIIGIIDEQTLNSSNLAKNIYEFININSTYLIKDITTAIIIIFFIIFIFKTLFFTLLIKLNNILIANLNFSISSKLFENYLFQKYYFYLNRGSSKLIQNISNEVNNLTNIYFVSFLSLLNEILLLISVSVLLTILSSISFFSIIVVFIVFSSIFYLVTKKFLKKWGYERNNHQQNSIRFLQESLRGIKQLRIYNLEINFLEYFKFHTKKYLKIEEKVNFISTIPKYYIELLGVISFVVIFKILLLNNYSSSEIILILGVFAASSLKVLPSINRIINSIVKIKYSHSVIELIFNEVRLKKNYSQNISKKIVLPSNNLILNNIDFKYQNSNSFLFKDVNLKIPLKKILGVIGDSGSGKTTLIDLIIGFLQPTRGSIYVNDVNIFKNLRSWQNNISYVQQFSFFTEDSIKINVSLGSKDKLVDENKIYYCLKIVGLKEFVESLPNKIETKLSELGNNLSGGQKQRLSIARALYVNSNILILDEATNSLDERSEVIIIKNIINFYKKKTIIIITHKKKLMKYFDVILKVENQKVKKSIIH
jgi:ABC-type bacteriocin/lantibiotic exporter with double-glycine peptidase domain